MQQPCCFLHHSFMSGNDCIHSFIHSLPTLPASHVCPMSSWMSSACMHGAVPTGMRPANTFARPMRATSVPGGGTDNFSFAAASASAASSSASIPAGTALLLPPRLPALAVSHGSTLSARLELEGGGRLGCKCDSCCGNFRRTSLDLR